MFTDMTDKQEQQADMPDGAITLIVVRNKVGNINL